MYEGDIHLWSARLDLPAATLRSLAATLTDEEADRATAQRLPRDRERLIAARGILRDILGRYLGQPPAQLRLRCGPFGKPELDTDGPAPLRFNLAHAGGMALYAISRGREVGVDLERVRAEIDHVAITGELFAASERAALASIADPTRRLRAFFTRWVCKEAYMKARGLGHNLPLAAVQVDLAGWLPRFSALDDEAGGLERWSLREIVADQGFVAALVADGPLRLVVPYGWSCPRLRVGNSALL
jgi:4'-phosphopantetheinyl transferase